MRSKADGHLPNPGRPSPQLLPPPTSDILYPGAPLQSLPALSVATASCSLLPSDRPATVKFGKASSFPVASERRHFIWTVAMEATENMEQGNDLRSKRVLQSDSVINATEEKKQDFPCKEVKKLEVDNSPSKIQEIENDKIKSEKLKSHQALKDIPEEKVLDDYRLIKSSEFDIAMKNCHRIGAGGIGTVYKLFISDKCVAVKVLTETSVLEATTRSAELFLNTWVKIISKIRHQNLVSVYGVCKVRGAIVYEFLPNGTLEERLKWPNRALRWGQKVNIALSICSVLILLHKRKPEPIVHGNLKSANILFDSMDTPKLCDLGLSCLWDLRTDICVTRHLNGATTMGTSECGELELLRKRMFTPESDILALGIIFLQLVTGKTANDIRLYVHGKYGSSELRKEKKQLGQKVSVKMPKVIDARLDIHRKCAADALEMLNLGLKCSDETNELPSLGDDVWPKIKSMSDRCLLS